MAAPSSARISATELPLRTAACTITEILGQGPGGQVLRADYDRPNGRPAPVSWTRIDSVLSAQRGGTQAWLAGWEGLSDLRHPVLIPVHGGGVHDKLPVLVSDLAAGDPLNEVVAATGALSLRHSLELLLPVAGALQFVHGAEAGVPRKPLIHGDLRPSRIIVGADGSCRLAGLGLPGVDVPVGGARGGPTEAMDCTSAPEQLAGRFADHRADAFALGSLITWALLGRPPWVASTAEGRAQEIQRLFQPGSALEDSLGRSPRARDVLRSLLAVDPSVRPATMGEVWATLRTLQSTQPEDEPVARRIAMGRARNAGSNPAAIANLEATTPGTAVERFGPGTFGGRSPGRAGGPPSAARTAAVPSPEALAAQDEPTIPPSPGPAARSGGGAAASDDAVSGRGAPSIHRLPPVAPPPIAPLPPVPSALPPAPRPGPAAAPPKGVVAVPRPQVAPLPTASQLDLRAIPAGVTAPPSAPIPLAANPSRAAVPNVDAAGPPVPAPVSAAASPPQSSAPRPSVAIPPMVPNPSSVAIPNPPTPQAAPVPRRPAVATIGPLAGQPGPTAAAPWATSAATAAAGHAPPAPASPFGPIAGGGAPGIGASQIGLRPIQPPAALVAGGGSLAEPVSKDRIRAAKGRTPSRKRPASRAPLYVVLLLLFLALTSTLGWLLASPAIGVGDKPLRLGAVSEPASAETSPGARVPTKAEAPTPPPDLVPRDLPGPPPVEAPPLPERVPGSPPATPTEVAPATPARRPDPTPRAELPDTQSPRDPWAGGGASGSGRSAASESQTRTPTAEGTIVSSGTGRLSVEHKPLAKGRAGSSDLVAVRVPGVDDAQVLVHFGPSGGPFHTQPLKSKGGGRYEGWMRFDIDAGGELHYWVTAEHSGLAAAAAGSEGAPFKVPVR